MKRRHRIKGAFLYWAAVAAVLAVHAYALRLDEQAQGDLRLRTTHEQA